jgi:hypothetical protein
VGGKNTASFELLLVVTASRLPSVTAVLVPFPLTDRTEPTGRHIKGGIALNPEVFIDVLALALDVPATAGRSTTVDSLETNGIGASGMGLSCALG